MRSPEKILLCEELRGRRLDVNHPRQFIHSLFIVKSCVRSMLLLCSFASLYSMCVSSLFVLVLLHRRMQAKKHQHTCIRK